MWQCRLWGVMWNPLSRMIASITGLREGDTVAGLAETGHVCSVLYIPTWISPLTGMLFFILSMYQTTTFPPTYTSWPLGIVLWFSFTLITTFVFVLGNLHIPHLVHAAIILCFQVSSLPTTFSIIRMEIRYCSFIHTKNSSKQEIKIWYK